MGYAEFLKTKELVFESDGKGIKGEEINKKLFGFQRDLVRWALKKGRSAIFADTGLGKTFMQLEWARLSEEDTLIIAPLSVAPQTIGEGVKLGIEVIASKGEKKGGITITNYEMLSHFNPSEFGAIVLDESSILKSIAGKTRKLLTDMFCNTNYKLCCTATPAPNDIAEIANHAEFLGIMSRTDMLSAFFVHDQDGWRLKGHAKQAFYEWLASWGMSVKKPSDLGYSDSGYVLPKLTIKPVYLESNYIKEGELIPAVIKGISDRAKVRKMTAESKIDYIESIITNSSDQWIVWCGLNKESNTLNKRIAEAVEVQGSDSIEHKQKHLGAFASGELRVLITKPKIAGFGMNFQNCHNMIFMGLSDSFESYYQCVRRCYRFGQEKPVRVIILLADVEQPILKNVLNKEKEAIKMSDELIKNVQQYEKAEIADAQPKNYDYKREEEGGKNWRLILGDSVDVLTEIEGSSIDLSVFSPPFQSLYTYSPTIRDIGNSKSKDEFFGHFEYIIKEMLRLTKPGRNCCVHVADIPAMLVRDGYIGIKDFSGDVINAFNEAGWIYHGRVTIDKNPQAQAIRTHSKALLFNQLRKDSAASRPALGDYILIFQKPGDNAVPIKTEISNDVWVKWAHPIWYGIKESDTLQFSKGRDEKDERHICPLQLGTIERCVMLWSNRGETVLSPFAGIGSEGYQSLLLGRKFIGIELKESYYNTAITNLKNAETEARRVDLVELMG